MCIRDRNRSAPRARCPCPSALSPLPAGTPPWASVWLCATRLHNRSAARPGARVWPTPGPCSIPPVSALFSPGVEDVRESTSGSTLFFWPPETGAPGTHRTTSGSPAASTGRPALRKGTGPVPQTWYRAHSHAVPPRPESRRSCSGLPWRRRLSLGGIGGHLVSKFVKQTKIDSRLADKPSLHQIALIETEPEKRTGGTRVLRKADAAVGQEQSRLNPTYRVVDQGRELLPLLVGDDGPQVLDLNHALTDKDDLGDFIDSRHPGITDQLRIQRRNAVRLLRIAGRAGLPLQHTRCAVQFAYCIDEGDKAVARTQGTCESDLLMAVGLANLDAAVLDEALEQLNALLEHVVPGVVA